jgi:hypothetical protein
LKASTSSSTREQKIPERDLGTSPDSPAGELRGADVVIRERHRAERAESEGEVDSLRGHAVRSPMVATAR